MAMERTAIRLGTATLLLVGLVLIATAPAQAAPTPQQMLTYKPRQDGVNCTTPAGDALAACKVELVKGKTKGSGWMLKDAAGQTLRLFFDSNEDNQIDVWSYFKDGVEVYREVDSTFAGKPDQYRWLNAGGMKFGVDATRDGRIKTWKAISPEEVSQELLAALAAKDAARFQALLLTEDDLKLLELPADQAAKLRESLKAAPAAFVAAQAKLVELGPKSVWMHLETGAPSCVPADQSGGRVDLIKHGRGTVMFESAGKTGWVQTGEMIQVGAAWRLVEGPLPGITPAEKQGDNLSPEMLKLVQELGKLDEGAPAAGSTAEAAVMQHHVKRADLIERIIALAKPEERESWIRQLADSLSAAAQAGSVNNNTALTRLQTLEKQLVEKMAGSNLTAYVCFREMQADYSLKIAAEKKDFAKVQTEWVVALTKFVETYPKAEDTPDVLLQLGMVSEFLNKEVEAKNWYGRLKKDFADKPQAVKAVGAVKRLDAEGQTIAVSGPTLLNPATTYSAEQLKGKFVVVYYWASWNAQTSGDFAKLKALSETNKEVGLVLVNLDNTAEEAKAYVQKTPAPGTVLFTPGGLEGKLATDYGIMVLPNVFLVGKDGKVVSRTVQVNALEDEIKKLGK